MSVRNGQAIDLMESALALHKQRLDWDGHAWLEHVV